VTVALVAVGLLGLLAGAFAGRSLASRGMRRARRAAMGLPPVARGPGILAVLPALEGDCPSCGARVKRHPAMAERRCAKCVAEAFDAEDEAFVESLKAAGWGK
jgi:hypothetical protein